MRSPEGAALSAAELEFIIGSGLSAERRYWPSGDHHDLGIIVAIAAFDVAGLAAGFHIASPSAPAPLGSAHQAAPCGARWLEEVRSQYAAAPVLLFVCGDLARACEQLGSRGYGELLVRAGAVGYAALLAALSLGLAGTAFASACHRVTASVSPVSAGSLRHLFTLAIGSASAGA